MNRIRRAPSLGQLDREKMFGPSPVDYIDLPIDLRERFISQGINQGIPGVPAQDKTGLGLGSLIKDVRSIAARSVINKGLLGRVYTINGTPQEVVKADYDRAYLLLNPASVAGLTTTGTLFSAQSMAGAGTFTSAEVGCANYRTGRFFLELSYTLGAGNNVTVDLQTKNPATGNYITAQTIFSVTANSNIYADLGTLGIDTDFQLVVIVPAATTVVVSLGYVLKDGLEGTSSGTSQTIYVGSSGVSPNSGYPILNGNEKEWFVLQNSSIYAVSSGSNLTLNVFEL
jgi:hypothetical protein